MHYQHKNSIILSQQIKSNNYQRIVAIINNKQGSANLKRKINDDTDKISKRTSVQSINCLLRENES